MFYFEQFPNSILQAGAIFLSIIIEALPFVLIGSILSGFIEVYITPDIVQRFLPKNRWLRILFGTFIGFVFPSCECGVVPIVNRLLEKKVPAYTAIPFLVTAPVINPIVLFATYTAFGNSYKFAFYRALGSIIVALIVGGILMFGVKEPVVKEGQQTDNHHAFTNQKGWAKFGYAWVHAIDEFFDTGRYLVFGCLFASLVQVYVPTGLLTRIGHNPLTATLLMMVLAFLLSLCSEADAFIGASFLSSFGFAPIIAFLVIGPMIDIKNVLMMHHYFKGKFIIGFIVTISIVILSYSLLIGGFA